MVPLLKLFGLPLRMAVTPPVTSQRLWKWLSKRQTGMGDYSLGMPETSETYFTIPYMVCNYPPSPSFFFTLFGFAAQADSLTVREKGPFPLDYTRRPLTVLCLARRATEALTLPARIPAHAWTLAASCRVLFFPDLDTRVPCG